MTRFATAVLVISFAGCVCAPATPPVSSLRGIVTGVDGQPLKDIAVVGATASATTDATGRYTLSISPGANTVRFASQGYVTVVKAVDAVDGLPTMLHITMLTAAPAVQLSHADGGVVNGQSGASVKVPPSAFAVAGGGTVAGQVSVRVTSLDPTTAVNRRAASGDFSANTTSGTTMIESTGMLDIDVRSNGQRATLAPGKQLEVRIPVAQGVTVPEATMALWSFDETQSRWVSEGTATYEASTRTYVATIGHMSLWNTDKPYLATCIEGLVVGDDGKPLPGAHVVSSGVDYIGASDTVTGADGVFRIAVKKNSTMDITATHQLGGGQSRQLSSGGDPTAVQPTPADNCADAGTWTAVKDVYTSPEGSVSCDSVKGTAPSQCLTDFGNATRCFQPAGSCVMTADTSGTIITYGSGCFMKVNAGSGGTSSTTSYYGVDGTLCYTTVMTISGITIDMAYTMADGRSFHLGNSGRSITCPDGTTVDLNSDQQRAAQACAPQAGASSSGQACTYNVPGSCTGAADCSAAGQICCGFSGVKTCTTPASCASVDGGVIP